MSRRRGIVVFAATSIVLLAGSLAVLVSKNTAGVNHQYKFASYATVESVAGASDTVLRGSVSGDASTFYDNGGFPSENANDGDRLRVVPVRVTSVFKGSESPGAQILVLQPDWEGNQSIPLAKGDDVILFVQRFVRPDIEKTFGGGRVYSQVGENASVFDVVNGRVKPREVSISSLSEPSPASPTNAQGSASFSIDEIAQAATKVPVVGGPPAVK